MYSVTDAGNRRFGGFRVTSALAAVPLHKELEPGRCGRSAVSTGPSHLAAGWPIQPAARVSPPQFIQDCGMWSLAWG